MAELVSGLLIGGILGIVLFAVPNWFGPLLLVTFAAIGVWATRGLSGTARAGFLGGGAGLLAWYLAFSSVAEGRVLSPVWWDGAVRATAISPALLSLGGLVLVRKRRPVTARMTLARGLVAAGLATTLPLPWLHGAAVWGLIVLGLLLCCMAFALAPARPVEEFAIDADGVRRTLTSGAIEEIRWENLTEVTVRTTSEGPYADDVYWLLQGTLGGVAVPSNRAPNLLKRLQRLPDFDNLAVVNAMGSTEDAWFPCWRGQAGDAEVCRVAPSPEG